MLNRLILTCYGLLSFIPAYDQYLAMKIDPKKLVMGVPWYGYDYPCLDFSQVNTPKLNFSTLLVYALLVYTINVSLYCGDYDQINILATFQCTIP
jgi:hypothetical protein